MTKIVGLTGGIGSGKTTIANYFKSFGVPIYIADDEAKKLMHTSKILNKIKNQFGEELVTDKQLNREKQHKLYFQIPKN